MTQISGAGIAAMKQLWAKYDLPPTDFTHWSAEFARETWDIVQIWTDAGMEEEYATPEEHRQALIKILTANECWDSNPLKQQWVPA